MSHIPRNRLAQGIQRRCCWFRLRDEAERGLRDSWTLPLDNTGHRTRPGSRSRVRPLDIRPLTTQAFASHRNSAQGGAVPQSAGSKHSTQVLVSSAATRQNGASAGQRLPPPEASEQHGAQDPPWKSQQRLAGRAASAWILRPGLIKAGCNGSTSDQPAEQAFQHFAAEVPSASERVKASKRLSSMPLSSLSCRQLPLQLSLPLPVARVHIGVRSS